MLNHQIQWADKTVVITGSGSGIGRAVAIALVKKGATVHLVDYHQARITALLDELAAYPNAPYPNVFGHTIDVTFRTQLEQLAAKLPKKIDILINCAGILHQGKLMATTHQDFRQVMDVNLWGVIHTVKAFLPQLRNRPQGSHIINIASIAGLIGAPEMAAYNASKFAILGLTESLAIELAADNIHVAAVCPGSIKTNLGQDGLFSSESTVAHTLRKTIHNGAKPEQVASDIIQTIERSSPFKLSCVELHWQFLWLCKRLFPALYPKFASFVYHRVIEKGFLDSLLMPKVIAPATK
ncbi:MAG: SDR family oxidoreductase [Cyanobacteria bacterium P01_D01_bin.105]